MVYNLLQKFTPHNYKDCFIRTCDYYCLIDHCVVSTQTHILASESSCLFPSWLYLTWVAKWFLLVSICFPNECWTFRKVIILFPCFRFMLWNEYELVVSGFHLISRKFYASCSKLCYFLCWISIFLSPNILLPLPGQTR